PADDVQAGVERTPLAQENLSGKQVVAKAEVVVGEFPVRVGKDRGTAAKLLETGQASLGLSHGALSEQTLGDVIRQPCPVNHVGAEILNAHYSDEGANLEVFGIDVGLAYIAALHLWVADLLGRRSLRRRQVRLLFAHAEQVLGRSAAAHAEHDQAQKKNAKPTFHSSTSSLSSRLVNTT